MTTWALVVVFWFVWTWGMTTLHWKYRNWRDLKRGIPQVTLDITPFDSTMRPKPPSVVEAVPVVRESEAIAAAVVSGAPMLKEGIQSDTQGDLLRCLECGAEYLSSTPRYARHHDLTCSKAVVVVTEDGERYRRAREISGRARASFNNFAPHDWLKETDNTGHVTCGICGNIYNHYTNPVAWQLQRE